MELMKQNGVNAETKESDSVKKQLVRLQNYSCSGRGHDAIYFARKSLFRYLPCIGRYYLDIVRYGVGDTITFQYMEGEQANTRAVLRLRCSFRSRSMRLEPADQFAVVFLDVVLGYGKTAIAAMTISAAKTAAAISVILIHFFMVLLFVVSAASGKSSAAGLCRIVFFRSAVYSRYSGLRGSSAKPFIFRSGVREHSAWFSDARTGRDQRLRGRSAEPGIAGINRRPKKKRYDTSRLRRISRMPH